jgi:glutamine cyclotransferase
MQQTPDETFGKFKNMKTYILHAIIFSAALSGCNNKPQVQPTKAANTSTLNLSYFVVNSFPHDTSLFTEGFLVHNGQIYESTGSPEEFPDSRSVVGVLDLKTGKYDFKIELDRSRFFGEGITILDNRLFQITYKNQLGFVYDLNSFKKLAEFNYSNLEGWGLTTDGKSLIMSDGTDKLTYLNPETQKAEKTLSVSENAQPSLNLNELEWIKGYIYANIWTTNTIVKIDPSTGKVVGKLDLGQLTLQQKTENPNAQELNGIAYDAVSDKIYITGKMWSKIYQIELAK